MSDKTKILDNFHSAMGRLSYANQRYHDNEPGWAVSALKLVKDHIDELIKEIPDE